MLNVIGKILNVVDSLCLILFEKLYKHYLFNPSTILSGRYYLPHFTQESILQTKYLSQVLSRYILYILFKSSCCEPCCVVVTAANSCGVDALSLGKVKITGVWFG